MSGQKADETIFDLLLYCEHTASHVERDTQWKVIGPPSNRNILTS